MRLVFGGSSHSRAAMASEELQEKDMEMLGADYVIVTAEKKAASKQGVVFVEARIKDDLDDEIDIVEVYHPDTSSY